MSDLIELSLSREFFELLWSILEEAMPTIVANRESELGHRLVHRHSARMWLRKLNHTLLNRLEWAKREDRCLDRADFEWLLRTFVVFHPKAEPTMQLLRRSFEAHSKLHQNTSAKSNPCRQAPIPKTQVDGRFKKMLAITKLPLDSIVGNPMGLAAFLDATIDGPACGGRPGQALSNGEIIYRYIAGMRNEIEQLRTMDDKDHAICIGTVGWYAGSTAWQLGNRRAFEDFFDIARRMPDEQYEELSCIVLNSMRLYDRIWDHSSRAKGISSYALAAYEGFLSLERTRDYKKLADLYRCEVLSNLAKELIANGAGHRSRVPRCGKTVGEVIAIARNARPDNRYGLCAEVRTYIIEAEAYYNEAAISKDKQPLYEAGRAITAAITIMPQGGETGLQFMRRNVLRVMGLIDRKLNPKSDGRHLRDALVLAKEMGALDQAIAIAREIEMNDRASPTGEALSARPRARSSRQASA